jgi:cobalt-zinc-cadmium efflux system outer membrane protein
MSSLSTRAGAAAMAVLVAQGVGPSPSQATEVEDPVPPLPAPLALGDVLRVVRDKNLPVAERRKRAEAAHERPLAEGLPDDPMLMLEWWQQPVDFSTIPLMVTARQAIPWASKLRLRRQAAEREAEAAGREVGDAVLRAEADAKRAYFDLVLAEDSLAVNDSVEVILHHVVAVAESRYQVGKAVQADVLRAQSELLMIDNERLDLERARNEAAARLNGLLDRPAAAAVPKTSTRPALAPVPAERDLVEQAVARRPDIARARAEVRVAQARQALAERENLPELSGWAGYMINLRGVHTFTLGLSSSLPVFASKRRSALARAAGSDAEAARIGEAALRRQAEVEIRAALLQLDTAARHARLHVEKLVPLADSAMESTLASFEAGRIEFLSVLEAARAVRAHHLDHLRYLIEFERRRADLELATAADLGTDGDPR